MMLTISIAAGIGFFCGFLYAWLVQQARIDKARYDCRCREMELKELKNEIENTTRSTAFMRRWARMGGREI